jgi:hypothetical protein
MFWSIIALVFSVLLDLFRLGRLSDREKDLEILILRHQLDILERKRAHPIKVSKADKLTLAVLTYKLKKLSDRSASRLRNVVSIFQPETVLKWHCELVRRKWTQENPNRTDKIGYQAVPDDHSQCSRSGILILLLGTKLLEFQQFAPCLLWLRSR